MNTMRPEDRLWLVTRQQADLRKGIALERAAATAATKRTTTNQGARGALSAGALRARTAARALLHTMTRRHAAAPHGATR